MPGVMRRQLHFGTVHKGISAFVLLQKVTITQKLGNTEKCISEYKEADACNPIYCFPNKLEDIAVLKEAIRVLQKGAKAYYYLGNLYYDKLQFEQAIGLWEKSTALDNSYPTVHRNLSIAYYNKQGNLQKAKTEMERLLLWMRQIQEYFWS